MIIEFKHNIGDEVWLVTEEGKAVKGKIIDYYYRTREGIGELEYFIEYKGETLYRVEGYIYSSKEDLINNL